MRVIGIDPGTRCGWAVLDRGKLIGSGVWDLRPRRHEGGGMRFLRLRRLLSELIGDSPDVCVAYEEVRRHAGTDAAHVYGGLIAVISSLCEQREIPYAGIPVSAIKRAATGRGVASKEEVVAAAHRRWPTAPVEDDNEAEARWCAVAATEQWGDARGDQ